MKSDGSWTMVDTDSIRPIMNTYRRGTAGHSNRLSCHHYGSGHRALDRLSFYMSSGQSLQRFVVFNCGQNISKKNKNSDPV